MLGTCMPGSAGLPAHACACRCSAQGLCPPWPLTSATAARQAHRVGAGQGRSLCCRAAQLPACIYGMHAGRVYTLTRQNALPLGSLAAQLKCPTKSPSQPPTHPHTHPTPGVPVPCLPGDRHHHRQVQRGQRDCAGGARGAHWEAARGVGGRGGGGQAACCPCIQLTRSGRCKEPVALRMSQ